SAMQQGGVRRTRLLKNRNRLCRSQTGNRGSTVLSLLRRPLRFPEPEFFEHELTGRAFCGKNSKRPLTQIGNLRQVARLSPEMIGAIPGLSAMDYIDDAGSHHLPSICRDAAREVPVFGLTQRTPHPISEFHPVGLLEPHFFGPGTRESAHETTRVDE